jgi:putative transposase
MARLPRLTAPGLPHHLIHRGNNRQAIFADDSDRSLFIRDLAELSRTRGVAIHAYVLMPNHVHLLATPAERESLPRLMQALGRRYVRRFNDRHRRTGTLWEGRYRSTVIDTDRYLLACMRYIDMNPVRAGLIEGPELFGWSSHAHYIGLRSDLTVTEHATYWALGNTPFDRQIAYRRLFDVEQDLEEIAAIRYATHRGWALGRPSFTDEVAGDVNRPLRPRRAGRPRKRPDQDACGR